MGAQPISLNDDLGVVPEMNTTPLIDVMLVLLIMFIITTPMQTHAVKLDLPTTPSQVTETVKNRIVIDARNRLLWNGSPIDLPTLTQYLQLIKQMPIEPELHLEPHADARYETVDQVLAVIKRVGIENMGFVGNERYKAF